MSDAHSAIDLSITDLDRLRRTLKKSRTRQVRSAEERALIQAVCLAWFNSHRVSLRKSLAEDLLADADALYKELLRALDRATSREKYDAMIKQLRTALSASRADAITSGSSKASPTTDTPPAFSRFVPNPAMQSILERRWAECSKCVSVKAPLAAIVMMGGLLEGLLLARVNKESNKTSIFSAASAPRDPTTGKTRQLQEWGLKNFIDVAHELRWITTSARNVGAVVRDYRNYVHPQKELSHGIELREGDAELFWEIAKSITRQLVE